MHELNTGFMRQFRGVNVIFSAVVVDVDLSSKEIRYASAGHPDQVLVTGRSRLALANTGPIIGLSRQAQYSTSVIPFRAFDTLCLFSDGAFEQINDQGTEFGEERLAGLLQNAAAQTPHEVVRTVQGSLDAFLGSRGRMDDVTLVVVSEQR